MNEKTIHTGRIACKAAFFPMFEKIRTIVFEDILTVQKNVTAGKEGYEWI